MKKTTNRLSPKKSNKTSNCLSSVDLHSICIRVNHIIERSNEIDNQLSQYEKQISKNKLTPISIQEDLISEYGSISPGSKSHSKISSPPKNPSQALVSDINYLSPKSMSYNYHESSPTKISDVSNLQENSISLNDLYKLVLEMKAQITEIAKNQEIMKEDIRRLASSK